MLELLSYVFLLWVVVPALLWAIGKLVVSFTTARLRAANAPAALKGYGLTDTPS